MEATRTLLELEEKKRDDNHGKGGTCNDNENTGDFANTKTDIEKEKEENRRVREKIPQLYAAFDEGCKALSQLPLNNREAVGKEILITVSLIKDAKVPTAHVTLYKHN